MFLKKLVGDVLDRVDQFPDFDPRRDYALTVSDSELTPRSARREPPGPRTTSRSTAVSAPFERLHPAVQHHVVNSLGWRSLRPLQEQAIEPILDGRHVLLGAPTAGGKTEAAVLPLLSRMVEERWSGLSVSTSVRCARC